jgi:uncharacterized protein
MKILISGASGLIGKALVDSFTADGHVVKCLRRDNTIPYWDINKQHIEPGSDNGFDVIIHLAGENIAEGRWTTSKKTRIRESRIKGTKLISDFFAESACKPKLLISGSAIGIYGNQGNESVDEESLPGRGFLADVCEQWERATISAVNAGIRVVNARFGMVLSSEGGALKKMLFPFKTGVGGIIGNGKQYISWVSISDVVEIIDFIIQNKNLKGPVNVTSPNPATNHDFTKILGRALHRPTVLPITAPMARLVLGEMADELLLSSIKALPGKLINAGYKFQHPKLNDFFQSIFK